MGAMWENDGGRRAADGADLLLAGRWRPAQAVRSWRLGAAREAAILYGVALSSHWRHAIVIQLSHLKKAACRTALRRQLRPHRVFLLPVPWNNAASHSYRFDYSTEVGKP